MARAVILSPHPDDAVLSLWHVLAGPGEVDVVNVFGGRPDPSVGSTWWDRLTGAADPVTRIRERHEEDRRALGLAGRSPEDLGFLDGQYREGEPDVDEIAARVAVAVRGAAVVYAPAALAGHRDHRPVLAAALRTVDEDEVELRLYADFPHALTFGLPAWVTGDEPQPFLDPAVYWDDQLRAGGVEPERWRAEVVRLDTDALARKVAAVREYPTQVPALEAQFGRFTEDGGLGYEVVWSRRA